MLYELILINEIEQRAKIIFLSVYIYIYIYIYMNLEPYEPWTFKITL